MLGLGALGAGVVFSAVVDVGRAVAAPAVAPTTSGPASSVELLKEGFCLRRIEQRCLEVALPASAPIEFARLPVLPDGRHCIYFYSDQVAGSKAVFVHVLESLDEDAGVSVEGSDSAAVDRPPLAARLKNLGHTLTASGAASGSVLLTAFRGSGGTDADRVFSVIPIEGPGEFAGRVVDLNGGLVPGSQRLTISVMISGAAASH
jgi:hypothetical protein